ncbi:flavodoxin [Paenibacillus sp. HN-1]|uniref:flavodoxin n=1 Tax=Paenibacillus TaxID=44249 RepID=UPI001CA9989A|nr:MULTISPECIES: flavodoxin [Paenibacillus]MBY9078135.1 flavodoxin [Paenibacillus sp. CGMCC 1.18879]MBY9083876.1 flavodoxin [Paenibacillus sinensis]
MKKALLLFQVILLILTLAACGTKSAVESRTSSAGSTSFPSTPGSSALVPSAETATSDNSDRKILIAYFSRVGNTDFDDTVDVVSSASLNLNKNGALAGNTELIADMIHDAVGGDLFRIETVNKYQADYDTVVDFAQQEKRDQIRPELSAHVADMQDYDTVFIGFPNWWYDLPMAVYNFLEEYDFSGKTVIPFTTHEGSGFSGNRDTIEKKLTGATVLDGLAVRGSEAAGAQRDVYEWLQQLGMLNEAS